MNLDLQKANMWKRISAALFDFITLGILAVGLAFLLSGLLGYDNFNNQVSAAYAEYEQQYGVSFELTQEEYQELTPEQLQRYEEAYGALIADEQAMYAYNMVIHMTLAITAISILLGYLLTEFTVPLLLGNGQTLGKKIFGICLMRTDGIQIQPALLFIRTILGKYTVETMIPVFLVMMIFFGTLGLLGTAMLAILLITQIALMCVTSTNSLIHDLLAKTVVVDMESQMIFRSSADLIAYQKRVAAEQAAKSKY